MFHAQIIIFHVLHVIKKIRVSITFMIEMTVGYGLLLDRRLIVSLNYILTKTQKLGKIDRG